MKVKQAVKVGTGKARALVVNTARANAGLIDEIIDATLDQWIAGDDFDVCLSAAQSRIADVALEKHGEHVRAGLSRAGLDVPLGPLSAAGIAQAIQEKSGLDFGDFSAESVLDAIDKVAAAQLSRVSGVDIKSIRGGDLQDTIKAAVRASLRSGAASKLLTRVLEVRARQLATMKRLDLTKAELRKVRNRKYQATWRETHKQAWD